jgi:S-DNA-T family DNA segregation ATPase FtsK/SpoIIIE
MQRDPTTPTSTPEASWSREALHVVAIIFGLALSFAVFARGQGLLGPFGRMVSSGLLFAFGGLTYPLVLAAVLAPLVILVTRAPPWRWSRVLGGAFGLVGLSILVEQLARTAPRAPSSAAGQLGVWLVGTLIPFVGPLGTALVGIGFTLLGVLAAFRWSLREALRDGGGWMGTALRASSRQVGAWLQQAARARIRRPPGSEDATELVVLPADETSAEGVPAAVDGPAEAPVDGPAEAPVDPTIPTPTVFSDPSPDAGAPSRAPRDETKDPASPPPSPGTESPSALEAAKEAHEPVILERKQGDAPKDDRRRQVVKAVDDSRPSYELPPLHLLDYEGDDPEPVDPADLKARATRLEDKLRTYGVEGRVAAIRPGPVVTTYEYEPAPGVKVSKIANLSDDIAMSMEAVRVRIVAPIPGRGVVGIELPNGRRENVYLKELVAHERFKKSKSMLTLALGKDAEGDVQVRDLQRMPHLLIAGTTGSGKSVSINTMILSILYRATPEQVKFIMVDPKMLELSLYNDIPHLLLPVVTDPKQASRALQWTVDEMERRYQLLSDLKVRDLEGYNKRLQRLRLARRAKGNGALLTDAKGKAVHDPWPEQDLPDDLPYIVVLIDEFADLMLVAPRDVEASVQRLAQKARAAGIHVLLATQRPSTDVITGVIKNNFPSRISFRVASRHDSATVLNAPGAENLLGMGDSLLSSVASPLPERIHGGFVSEQEVERVVEFWKAQAQPRYDASILQRREGDEGDEGGGALSDLDEHYDAAVRIVCETRRASISALQRRLRVGYNRAARMIEAMEAQGVVGPATGPKGEREVLAPPPPEA